MPLCRLAFLVLFTAALLPADSVSVSTPLARADADTSGAYRVRFTEQAWDFAGSVGHSAAVRTGEGSDAIGVYREIVFAYQADAPRESSIRLYTDAPIALFTSTVLGPGARTSHFPRFSSCPRPPYHLSFEGIFAGPSFYQLGAGSPWIFFDDRKNTWILSPASRFLAATNSWSPAGEIQSGIDEQATDLPDGFSHRVILVGSAGINEAFRKWGQALTALHGKSRPANDSDTTLKYLGYWTDNGAAYYYAFNPALGYAGTLLAVKDEFERAGVRLGYVQLDSWFYPKGPRASWDDNGSGMYLYEADRRLFPEGLGAFQRQLGVPLVTHARWIDRTSPYRQQYEVSGDVVIDARYWRDRAAWLRNSGVVTYEQDWLGSRAQAAQDLRDPRMFFDNMAAATKENGLTMQYSMALPAHFLQSVRYDNVTSIRTGPDRFNPDDWDIYTFRLASALGVWPWVDVFNSSETGNLLVATLSAGIVGVGDRLGSVSGDNIRQAARADGVLVKPDEPLTPADDTYLSDARNLKAPFVAYTTAQRAVYVFAHTHNRDASLPVRFVPADFGIAGLVYIYNTLTGSGTIELASAPYQERLATESYCYWIIVPVANGIAFLGDVGHFVTLGRQRVIDLSTEGRVRATIAFAAGEESRTIFGYADRALWISAEKGAIESVRYDATTGLFSARLTPEDGVALVEIAARR